MKQNKCGLIIHIDDYRKKALSEYALLHRDFLRTYHPQFYSQLLALNKFNSWLQEIDNIAECRFEFAEKFDCPFDETEYRLYTEVIFNLNH